MIAHIAGSNRVAPEHRGIARAKKQAFSADAVHQNEALLYGWSHMRAYLKRRNEGLDNVLRQAMIGLNGVIAYRANPRTHQIGVRIALGADRRTTVPHAFADVVSCRR